MPDGTVCITVGADVQELGLHYVVIAWDEHAAGCIIYYDFFEFLTEYRPASDCEVLILEGYSPGTRRNNNRRSPLQRARSCSPI